MRHFVQTSAVAFLLFLSMIAWASPVEDSAKSLVQRIVPAHADKFDVELIEGGGDVFEIEQRGERIVLRGNNGVSIASALNHYLKEYCKASVSVFWADQLALPDTLPAVPVKVRVESALPIRYCFNYCCFSYSMAWWDWAQWERAIDWMALSGINMPLAVTGQEAVWQDVARELDLKSGALDEFFVGSAFLPFGWMGCMDQWCGPLSQNWIDQHADLQKRILARERELGMKPVQQGFTGHVPKALRDKFPDAKFQQLPSWCGFPGTVFLDPADPLFERVGKLFIEKQNERFGTDHFYASDTFIEMSPPSNDPEFLAGMGRAVYGSMKAADPDAIWLMQGWLFYNNPDFWKPPQTRALLGAVPDDRMYILDLFCESTPTWNLTESFYGKPWIWCIIQTFGDQVSLHGGLPQINDGLSAAMTDPKRGNLRGAGFIMEGLGYNPVVWDLMSDLFWKRDKPDMDKWVRGYAGRRYGRDDAAAEEAWEGLLATVYRKPGQSGSVMCGRPTLVKGQSWNSTSRPYGALALATAFERLLSCGDRFGGQDAYRYDIAHVLRQLLADHAGVLCENVADAYKAKDLKALGIASAEYLALLEDVDTLLASRPEFLLGRWLEDAKRWGRTDEERALYEWNARTQITLWGPKEGVLHDYASKQWSGLIRGFYLPRWKKFTDALESSLANGTQLDMDAFTRDIQSWEYDWTRGQEKYADAPAGDTLEIARTLWAKYRARVCEPEAVSLSTGKPVSCSASLDEYSPNLANDGRVNSTDRYWATDVNVDPAAWWSVDLEKPVKIGRIVPVFYYGDDRSYGFMVEVSRDGKAWETVADYRDKPQKATRNGVTCRFDPKKVRHIRVTVTSSTANTGRHLVEVMAFKK